MHFTSVPILSIKLLLAGMALSAVCSGFLQLEEIWALADIVNGLMAIPNLIALLGLSGIVVTETKKYFKHLEIRDAKLKAYKERHIKHIREY